MALIFQCAISRFDIISNTSKPKTLGKERKNKGYSPRKQGGKQRWIKSDRLKVTGRVG